MPAFEYKALNRAGKEVSGVRDADSEKSLRSVLKKEGIYVTRLSEAGNKKVTLSGDIDVGQYFERISASDIAMFTRQLATLSKAGIPLVEALSATAEQTEKDKLKRVLSQIKQEVSEGSSLAQALHRQNEVFSPIFPNMIRAGEASGTLDQVLLRLAEFTEKSVRLRQQIFSAMMYPVIMIIIGSLIMVGLFVFVIPQITQIFEDSGQQLPILTRIIIFISHGLREYWWLAIMGLAGVLFGFQKWKNSASGRTRWDAFKLRVPVIGPIVLMIGVSRFTRTLATLIRSGVPLLTALDITKNVLGNEVLISIIDEARVAVKEGASLGEPLKQSGRFPPIVTHMISTGEKSGALDEMLGVVSDAYDTQVETKITGLTSLLEPFMIVGMGITIGIIVFAVLLPILQMNEFIN